MIYVYNVSSDFKSSRNLVHVYTRQVECAESKFVIIGSHLNSGIEAACTFVKECRNIECHRARFALADG